MNLKLLPPRGGEAVKRDKRKWTADEREFDRILDRAESPVQLTRIIGRQELRAFVARFTEQQLAAMATTIGAKPCGGGR